LRNAPTPLVSTYAYVNPAVAVLLGWLMADEQLTTRTVAAAAVIVVGVALIVSAPRRREPVAG
jgi:drug/metabolite transporter (DMT)-like permease